MRAPRGRGWWILWAGLLLLPGHAAAQTCGSPLTIPAGGGVFTGTTAGGSAVQLLCASATAQAPEAVYTWTPAVSGTAILSTAHSDFDTVLAVETQCGVASSTLAGGCGDDGQPCCADCSSLSALWDSRVTPTVTAGVPLFVIVDGYGTAAHGAYRLAVTPPLGSTTTLPACGTTTTTSTTTTTVSTTSTTTTSTTTTTVVTTSTTTTTGPPTTTTSTTATTTTSTTTTTTLPLGTCGNPRTLPAAGGTVSGTTSGTSLQTGSCGNSGGSPEQVYQWVPSSSGQTTIQTCGPGTAYDTVVYVRQGTCTGSELAFPNGCNDDACANVSGLNRASRVTPTVTSGQTYFIIVDGYGGAQGAYTLSVSTPGAVTTTTTTLTTTTTTSSTTTTTTSTTSTTTTSTTTTTTTTTSTTTTTLSGAACSSPTVIPAAGGTFSGTTSGSNTLTTPCDAATGPEQVFQWTPSTSGVAVLQTCGGTTNYDTVLSLRTSPCASGTTVASGCNNDLCVCVSPCVGNFASKITPTVTAGTTYYAIVDGHGAASGNFTLMVQAPPPPTTTTSTTVVGTTTTTLPPLALTGFVPGIAFSSDAVIDGTTHRAYVASKQFGLSVVDVTTPASPVVLGAANPPFYGARVSRIGTRAVVTASGLGLRVVNLTDETHPVTAGTLAGTYSAVVMKDANTAYATSNGVFQVINVNVTPPVVTTSLNLTSAGDFKVVGGLAYIPSVISGQAALKIVNPATTPPTLVGQVGGMPNSFALDVAVSGTTAYVALGSAGIQVVNVSDTAHPTLGTVLGQSASALVVSGSRLYAVDGSLLKLIDISTPGTPTLIGSGAAYAGQRIAVDGATAYLTAGTGAATGLSIQTVSGSAPVLVANEADSVNNLGVAVSGTRAVEAGGASGMKSLSVATPSAPTVGGTFASFVTCVALSGTTAYAFDANTGLLKVIDVSGAPSLSGSTSIGACGDMQVVGTTLYVASGGFGLRVVNVATPSSPAVTGTANTPGTALGVAVLGNYAYVADTTSIQVVDVSDVNNPTIVNSVPTTATAVSALGNRLYAVVNGSLKILSLTTPSAPSILNAGVPYDGVQGVVSDPGRPNVIYLAGPALNHGDTPPGIYEGIIALNVANAAAPVQIGTNLVTPGTVKKLAFANGRIYASDSAGIVDVVTP